MISVVIPCYNEEENVVAIGQAVVGELDKLTDYNYEIIYIDNHSTNKTQELIRGVCAQNPRVRAIFNVRNFGQFNSPYHAICQAHGDCVITLCADFQDPVELIPTFVREWENGYQIVCGVKRNSEENKVVYFLRSLYYKMIKCMSTFEQIEHFTGFGLYDRSFVDVLRNLHDPMPFLRNIVAELGGSRKEVPYDQPLRKAGKTHNTWYLLYDAAMLSFTSYTKIGLRLALIIGFVTGAISLVFGVVYLILKLAMWDRFIAGQAPLMIGMFFLGALQLFFIGLTGEYILSINGRMMNRPLVIEAERINFADKEEKQSAPK